MVYLSVAGLRANSNNAAIRGNGHQLKMHLITIMLAKDRAHSLCTRRKVTIAVVIG